MRSIVELAVRRPVTVVMVAIAVAAAVVALGLGFLLARRVTRPVLSMSVAAESIAASRASIARPEPDA